MNEHICDLKISMDDILFCKIQQTLEDISYNGLCRLLCETHSFSEFTFEVAFIAYLCDDVAISVAGEYLEASENVGMV